MSEARIVAFHYGAAGFEAAPLVPALFARDFVHLLFPASEESVPPLTSDNPNRSLFKLASSGMPDPGPPDLVTVSTDARDSEALKRDQQRLAENALCILARVEFMPLALGHGLPDPVLAVLGSGFRFAGFPHPLTQTTAATRSRSAPLPTHGDVVFVRELVEVKAMARSEEDLYLKTRKLAFLAIAFGQLAYGLEALGAARRLAVPAAMRDRLQHRNYDRFLRGVAVSAAKSARLQRKRAARADSAPPLEKVAGLGRWQTTLRRLQGALQVLRGQTPKLLWVPGFASRGDPTAYWWLPFVVRKALGVVRRSWRAWEALTAGVPLSAPQKPALDPSAMSPLELLLNGYGFWLLARETYTARLTR